MKFEENKMYSFAEKLFPICRSLTGKGVRLTLNMIKEILPQLKIYSVSSGTKSYDWKIPNEWNITEGYIEDQNKNRIIDFKDNNLHVIGYSQPVNKILKLSELKKHIFTLPKQPLAIPYITSYYKKRWGFCMSHSDFLKLKDQEYKVVIKSSLKKGKMNYAELYLPGKLSKKEILLTTYFCHPSMANDNLSELFY